MPIKIGIPDLPQSKPELGSPEWFERRARDSLRPLGDGRFDFSDSALLYSPTGATGYESAQKADSSPYRKLITEPEIQQLRAIAPSIVSRLPSRFEFVDLGPGTARKENFFFEAAHEQNKRICYRPVDISQTFLDSATRNARARGIFTQPAHASFEDFAQESGGLEKSRFVSIGATFSNSQPEDILPLLEKMTQRVAHTGHFFINTQSRDRVNMDEVVAAYESLTDSLVAPKLRLLGLDPRLDVEASWVTPGIEIWCRLKNSTAELERRGIGAGSELLLLRSLRYSQAELHAALAGKNYELFDCGSSFVGALIRVEASALAARPQLSEVFGK